MAEYPAHLAHTHRLFDGRTVTIRPARPGDAGGLHELLNGLSGESRYLRFQKWIGAPSDKLAGYLADIDYDRQMAFVCTASEGADGKIVGDARYYVSPDGKSCEFGVMIDDAWHNTGIAGLLMDDLIHAARARGLKRMEGQVLAVNPTMLRFARGLGFAIRPVPGDITAVRIVKKL